MKTQAEIDWEEKYGGMTDRERNDVVKDSLGRKLGSYFEKQLQAKLEQEQRVPSLENRTYPQIVKAIPEALERIEKYKEIPQGLVAQKRRLLTKSMTGN